MTAMDITPETAAKFDRILDLEQAVRVSTAVQAFRTTGVSDYRAGQQATSLEADKSRLFAAVDALTLDEAQAFRTYRLQAK